MSFMNIVIIHVLQKQCLHISMLPIYAYGFGAVHRTLYKIKIRTLSCSMFTESLAVTGFLNLHFALQLVYPVQSRFQGPVTTLAREAEECSPDKSTAARKGSSQVQRHQGKVQALGIRDISG